MRFATPCHIRISPEKRMTESPSDYNRAQNYKKTYVVTKKRSKRQWFSAKKTCDMSMLIQFSGLFPLYSGEGAWHICGVWPHRTCWDDPHGCGNKALGWLTRWTCTWFQQVKFFFIRNSFKLLIMLLIKVFFFDFVIRKLVLHCKSIKNIRF